MPGCEGQAQIRLVAPVCSEDDARAVVTAGADEMYVGAMLDEWAEVFGEGDVLSRRQGRTAHVRTLDELAAVARFGAAAGKPVALALNGRYSRPQEPYILELARQWEEMGGLAVIVADPGILLALREGGSKLRLHLSSLVGVFNHESVALFAELGVSRIVLPRDLTVREIEALTRASGAMAFEVIGMYQKCAFIDGFCGFRHAVRLPSGGPAVFDYQAPAGGGPPVVWSDDPEYEGHGCQVGWRCGSGEAVRLACHDDGAAPWCAACALLALKRAGVAYLKLAGRGYGREMIARAVAFLREAEQLSEAEIRELYARTFGGACDGQRCYYTW